VFVELWSAGATTEITELNSDLRGSAILLGRAENRMERAFVVVGVGEVLALAATETEDVRTGWADEAASEAIAVATWLTTELKILSIVPKRPSELAAGDASLAIAVTRAILLPCCSSPALSDALFTLPGATEDCVVLARERRRLLKSGEVRED
jgi:hypothetical protein